MTGFVVCPILFYLPKFFEIRTVETMVSRQFTVNCTNLRLFSEEQLEAIMGLGSAISDNAAVAETEVAIPPACLTFNFNITDLSSGEDSLMRTVFRNRTVLGFDSTPLRQNHYYYLIYILGLNTAFASVTPLLSLIYLNICTVLGEFAGAGASHMKHS